MQFTNTNKNRPDVQPEQPGKSGKTELKIIAVGGTEAVTKNLTVYEYGEDIIVVDCGIGFPDAEMLGVDVVIPDMTYLVENSQRVRGVFITHAHEDHIGAVPYLLQEMDVPVYANKLVQGLIRERLKEKRFKGLNENVKFHLLSPESGPVEAGCFKVTGFRVNHSVPSSMGFAIETPQGLVLHMADYKIDWTPVLDKPIDLAAISSYGKQGVLCLLSDALGSTTEGYSKSENSLNKTFDDLFEAAVGRQVLVTTISSNVSRMYQIIQSAQKYGRKVVLSGRSIEQTSGVARDLGYLPFADDVFVKEDNASSHPQKDLVYIVAGCYGQQGSSLDRLSRDEHDDITLEENAMVIFSADPNPPGVEQAVERVMDNLTLKGAEVIYSKIQQNLHVSGHGSKGDLTTVASIVRPKYFIPIGGTVTKARAYRNMVESLGFKRESVFELLEGESVGFSDGNARRGERMETKPVYIDGSGVGDVGPVVIKDREVLSTEGVFVVVIPTQEGKFLKGNIEIISRGFVYVKESKSLMGRSKEVVNKVLDKAGDNVEDWGGLKRKIENDLGKFLGRETGRKPLIIVHSINI
jgi:ribonuclease J